LVQLHLTTGRYFIKSLEDNYIEEPNVKAKKINKPKAINKCLKCNGTGFLISKDGLNVMTKCSCSKNTEVKNEEILEPEPVKSENERAENIKKIKIYQK